MQQHHSACLWQLKKHDVIRHSVCSTRTLTVLRHDIYSYGTARSQDRMHFSRNIDVTMRRSRPFHDDDDYDAMSTPFHTVQHMLSVATENNL